MRVNNDRTQGIYLREEMGFIPNVKEIKEDGKKKNNCWQLEDEQDS